MNINSVTFQKSKKIVRIILIGYCSRYNNWILIHFSDLRSYLIIVEKVISYPNKVNLILSDKTWNTELKTTIHVNEL